MHDASLPRCEFEFGFVLLLREDEMRGEFVAAFRDEVFASLAFPAGAPAQVRCPITYTLTGAAF